MILNLQGPIDIPVLLLFTFFAHIPAIILVIIGLAIRKNNKKPSDVLFILAGIYTICGLGICGMIVSGVG